VGESSTVILHAVGDITLGDHPLCAGFGAHSQMRRRPPAFAFEHVAGTLAEADIRLGNLECTLSEHGLRPNDYHSIQMRGHAEYLQGLTATGFQVLNVATNHSEQHGPEPFAETVEMVKNAGIAVVGVAGPNRTSVAVQVVAKDVRVGFVGYSLRPRQYFTREPLYAEGRRDDILADVRAARQAHDVVVVSFHWGDEFIAQPSPKDVLLAHAVIDAGADLIIGHHPHVLRGVERYGRGWIVYSLGNFVCDMLWSETLRETAICECRLTKAGVEDVRLIPGRINDDSQPVLLNGPAAARFDQRLAELNGEIKPEAAASPAALADYEVAAHAAHADQRAQSHKYFLRNAYRFPPRILVAQVGTYIRNRLAERGIGSASTG
jgi:gamma-polyglutamate biosynthesis protein CapA